LSSKLLADLKEAHDRLNQSPDNSSRPPSTRAPWEGGSAEPRDDDEAEERKPEEAGQDTEEGAPANDQSTGPDDKKGSEQEPGRPTKNSPGKPGKPKGAPGHGRTVELAVTAERIHRPHQCAWHASFSMIGIPSGATVQSPSKDLSPLVGEGPGEGSNAGGD
jgi:transposase